VITAAPLGMEQALQQLNLHRARTVKQREMIAALEKYGHAHLLPEAHRLLAQLESTQRVLGEHVWKTFAVRT
jgi:hypothetical protein